MGKSTEQVVDGTVVDGTQASANTTSTNAVTPARGSTFSPFRYPVFRAIWIANLFSNIGATLQSVGAAWMMTELTPSHMMVALVQASATLPIMLFGIFAGAIADNYDRRKVMLVAQVSMLIVSASLAIMAYADMLTPNILLFFTLSVGAGAALNSPAWQASVRQQVAKSEISQAIALNSISFNIARSIGPAMGGMMISLLDTSFVFAVNALSYIGLIGVLLWWKPEARNIEARPILPAVAIGVRFCLTNGPLRRILLRGLALGICLSAFQALLPALVSDKFVGTELNFGMMLGMFGIGSICSAPFIGKLRLKFGLEGILMLGAWVFALALALTASVQNVYQALPAAALAGMAWVAVLTTLNTAVQMRAPDEILGRCLSMYQAVTFGGMALGSWIWGIIADWQSLSFSLYVAAGALLLSFYILRMVAPLPKIGEGVVGRS